MKVNCDVCERTQATVLCCADDAALCASCDSRVHAANKLAGKHQRVPLLYPSPQEELPLCDICQEKVGYFFCVEDRALLCRNCDFSIHSANALTSKHRRFLVTGIQVALQVITESTNATHADSQGTQGSQLSSPRATDSKQVTSTMIQAQTSTCAPHLPKQISPVHEKLSKKEESYLQDPISRNITEIQRSQDEPETNLFSTPSTDHQQSRYSPGRLGIDWEAYSGMSDMNTGNERLSQRGAGGFVRRGSVSEYWADTIPGWKVEELMCLPEMPSFQATADCGSTKPETSSSGDLDWHIECNAFEEFSECNVVSDVPAVPSPPTASGLPRTGGFRKFGKNLDLTKSASGDTLVVPDIGVISSTEFVPDSPSQKRMRVLYD